jgi:hypothetical protein
MTPTVDWWQKGVFHSIPFFITFFALRARPPARSRSRHLEVQIIHDPAGANASREKSAAFYNSFDFSPCPPG